MTSIVAHFGLSEATREMYRRYGVSPRNIEDRLYFYYVYLQDVVPLGVTVQHIPGERDNNEPVWSIREEIQLLTPSGKIFMSGLVSLDHNTTTLENTAAGEAYADWIDGEFVPGDEDWRFFTGHVRMRFYSSRHGDEWDHVGEWHPIIHAQEVAAFLQQQYDRLSFH